MTHIQVPFIDLKQRFEEEKSELMACVERVLEKGALVLTPELAKLEEEVCEFTGSKFCIGLNSGTDALMMALWANGIGRGDEVIQPAVSFVATTGAISHVGATPVMCDVGDDNLIDVAKIEERITTRTKAIMPVHWAGKMCDMDAIESIANKHGLLVIEDSAQAMGSYINGRHGGTFGQSGAISCHPLKVFNGVGDGGLLLTNDEQIAQKVMLYRNHGTAARDDIAIYGVNSRLDIIHAEVLRYRLQKVHDVISRRRNNAKLYKELITVKDVHLPVEKVDQGFVDSFVMFLIFAERRDQLKKYLEKFGIETLVYYGTPLHLHRAAQIYEYRRGDFPVAERNCSQVLALPHHQHLTAEQIAYVASKINDFYGA